ncbi:MAG: TIGR03067 domain-containing protein [Terriglobia bacterium]
MISRKYLLLIGAICVTCLPAFAQDSAKVLKSLEGTWEVASVVDNGKTIPNEAIRGAKVIFANDTMTLISPDGKEKTNYTIKLDPTKNPKGIDITATAGTFKGKTGLGIYDLNGDVLRVCQPYQPTIPRPTSFAVPEGSGLNLMVLKKIQK